MSSENLTFSIIIPTYERPVQISKCLKSITNLDYPKNKFEVIVVDDGSINPPNKLINSYKDRLNIRLFTQKNAGPAGARNTGAKKASGKFLAFTDDDCEPESNWLNAFENEFKRDSEIFLGGYTINSLSDNAYSTASQELINYLYSYYNSEQDNATFFASNNIAVRADLFQGIGGFDVTTLRATAEDREICDRWVYKRHKMTYTTDAIVFHSHDLSLSQYWGQHFNYGRGAYYFRKVRALRGQEKVKLEPTSFYSNLIIYPYKRKEIKQKTYISILLVLSQIANALGYYWERIRRFYNKN
ncbi:MAG: glycosyltransferase [Thermodesulfobacteriota bacterium]